ncbi:MAG TPA: glycosyltransferase family 2 protein [Blastocatellia bacterium]|nr:glycosyltransferase family 2 protein [Blastocatellia bacterium]
MIMTESRPVNPVNPVAPLFDTISAVLPAFNEEENIETATTRMAEVLRSLQLRDWEVIIVDDGSQDSTGQIADRLAAEDPEHIRVFHHNPNRGYAEALRTGFTSARHRLIFYTDSDNQFDVRELKNLLPLIENADLVCGFRIYRFDPLTRLVLSWGFNLLVRIIFRIRVRDVDCAFKLFRREVFEKVTIESKRFFVDAEVLAKAKYFGFRMVEIGVRHYPRQAGRSTVRPSHILSTLAELGRIWINIHSKPRGKR